MNYLPSSANKTENSWFSITSVFLICLDVTRLPGSCCSCNNLFSFSRFRSKNIFSVSAQSGAYLSKDHKILFLFIVLFCVRNSPARFELFDPRWRLAGSIDVTMAVPWPRFQILSNSQLQPAEPRRLWSHFPPPLQTNASQQKALSIHKINQLLLVFLF